MRIAQEIIAQTHELVFQFRRAEVPAFAEKVLGPSGIRELQVIVDKAKRYRQLMEAYASRPMDDATRGRASVREHALVRDIQDIAQRFGCKVTFHGDSRGFCVKLHPPLGHGHLNFVSTDGYGIG